MNHFYRSITCRSLLTCKKCRTNRDWRSSICEAFGLTEIDFPCPFGFSSDNLPPNACEMKFDMPKCIYLGEKQERSESECAEKCNEKSCCNSGKIDVYSCAIKESVERLGCYKCDSFYPDCGLVSVSEVLESGRE